MSAFSSTRPLLAALALALAVSAVLAAPAAADPAWTEPTSLSIDMGDFDTDVVVAPSGSAVVGWVEEADDDTMERAVVRERTMAGRWGAMRTFSTADEVEHVRLGVDGAGAMVAVWAARPDGGLWRIQVARRPADGQWGAAQTIAVSGSTGTTLQEPDVAVSPGGRVAVTWELDNGSSSSPQTAILLPSGDWQKTSGITRPGTISSLQSWPDDTGRTTVVWLHTTPDLDRVVRVSIHGGTPEERETSVLSDAAFRASSPSLAGNADGRTLVTWTQQLDAGTIRVAATTRSVGSAFPAPTVLTDAVTSAARNTTTAVTPAGEGVVVFERANTLFARSHDGSSWQPAVPVPDAGVGLLEDAVVAAGSHGRLALAWSQVTGEDRRIWSAVRTDGSWGDAQVVSASGREGRDPVIAASANGDAVVSWRDNVPSRQVGAAGFDGSGPVSTVGALPATRLKTQVPVSWSARDRWSDVANHRVQRRVTAWNGDLGSFTTWFSATTSTSANASTSPGRTLCVRSRATDSTDTTGAWAKPRCSTTPVDDRTAVVRSGAWAKKSGSTYYRGTYREATANGARLEWPGARGRSFALVAATGPGHGTVAVYLGNTLLKQLSLHRATAKTKVVLSLKTFGSLKTGPVQVRVVGSGKPVRIDGIVVRR